LIITSLSLAVCGMYTGVGGGAKYQGGGKKY
jgi:hypothetical protein